MLAFLESAAFLTGIKAFSSFAIGGSAIVIAHSVLTICLAMKAKHKAREAIHKVLEDSKMHKLDMYSSIMKIEPEDIMLLNYALDKAGSDLSDRDKEFIQRGLEQNSKVGAERYARELLGSS